MKKKSPQYVLVNGNIPMALCPHLSDVLSLLSDRSWGIAVTLEDLADVKEDHLNNKQKKSMMHVGTHTTDFSGG